MWYVQPSLDLFSRLFFLPLSMREAVRQRTWDVGYGIVDVDVDVVPGIRWGPA
jgi:hypothetical protein